MVRILGHGTFLKIRKSKEVGKNITMPQKTGNEPSSDLERLPFILLGAENMMRPIREWDNGSLKQKKRLMESLKTISQTETQ